jgi:hypothetical protein
MPPEWSIPCLIRMWRSTMPSSKSNSSATCLKPTSTPNNVRNHPGIPFALPRIPHRRPAASESRATRKLCSILRAGTQPARHKIGPVVGHLTEAIRQHQQPAHLCCRTPILSYCMKWKKDAVETVITPTHAGGPSQHQYEARGVRGDSWPAKPRHPRARLLRQR